MIEKTYKISLIAPDLLKTLGINEWGTFVRTPSQDHKVFVGSEEQAWEVFLNRRLSPMLRTEVKKDEPGINRVIFEPPQREDYEITLVNCEYIGDL